MSIKVYVLTDPILIDFAQDGDIEGFKEYLDSDDTIYFNDPGTFNTEAEALAYCAGIGYGKDERAPVERYLLRSSEEDDLPFIEVIENYWKRLREKWKVSEKFPSFSPFSITVFAADDGSIEKKC